MHRLILLVFLSVPGTMLLPDAALAYVGPGVGLSAIGTLLAVAAVVVLAIVGLLWLPVKRMLGRNKTTHDVSEAADD